jgi:hypothetical protein
MNYYRDHDGSTITISTNLAVVHAIMFRLRSLSYNNDSSYYYSDCLVSTDFCLS